MYVYKIVNKINNKTYVGQTISSIAHRWSSHKSASLSKKGILYSAIRKYGLDNFFIECVEVLPEGSTIEDLHKREIFWIKELKSLKPNGYNIKPGGNGGGKHSKETKLKISEGHKGKILSEEHRVTLSNAHTGKPLSKEHKVRISQGQMGRKFSKESRLKLSESVKKQHIRQNKLKGLKK